MIYLLHHATLANAQEEINDLTLSVRMSDSSQNRKDSIRIVFYDDILFDQTDSREFFIFPDKDGLFSFRLKQIDHIGKIMLYIYGSEIYFINDYFVEPGDSIDLVLSKLGDKYLATFSGKSQSKYTYRDFMISVRDNWFKDARPFKENYGKKKDLLNECIKSSLEQLTSIQNQLSKNMYQILKADCLGFYYAQWIVNVSYYYKTAENNAEKEKFANAYKNFKFIDEIDNKNIASLSDYYLLYHLAKVKFELLFKSGGAGYKYVDLYEGLKAAYTGEMRERLLVAFLDNPRSLENVINYDQKEYSYCVTDVSKLIKNPYLKEILQSKLLLKKGVKVKDFSLPDQTGAIVSLKSFEGKVVLLDIWGDRCTGCAQFFKIFESNVYPKLKDNPEFELVSISIDDSKEKWFKGIDSGKYTQINHINLYSDGKGINHPFFKYYNIQAIPFILLIDRQGRVYSRIFGTMGGQEIYAIIKEALLAKG